MKAFLIVTALLLGSISYGQMKTVVIHTSAECDECKDRLETKLNYTKGVQFAELNVPTRDLTVKYNEKKISLDQLKKDISELGYDADDLKADDKAQKALPACCQPAGHR